MGFGGMNIENGSYIFDGTGEPSDTYKFFDNLEKKYIPSETKKGLSEDDLNRIQLELQSDLITTTFEEKKSLTSYETEDLKEKLELLASTFKSLREALNVCYRERG